MAVRVYPLLCALLCSMITHVLAEYECFCSSNIAASVLVQPFDFSSVLGTLKLNECKQTFLICSTGQRRTVQFQRQAGYVSDAQGRVVKCSGILPNGDVVHTPSPLSVPTTTTKSVVKPSVHGNVQLCPTNVSRVYQHGSFCYELSDRSDTWFTARDTCKNKGGSLVVINNEDQQHFLQKMMANINKYMDVWIGLSAQPHSPYKWVTGENVTYTHWFLDGFADSYHGLEDCILLTGTQHGHPGRWADV